MVSFQGSRLVFAPQPYPESRWPPPPGRPPPRGSSLRATPSATCRALKDLHHFLGHQQDRRRKTVRNALPCMIGSADDRSRKRKRVHRIDGQPKQGAHARGDCKLRAQAIWCGSKRKHRHPCQYGLGVAQVEKKSPSDEPRIRRFEILDSVGRREDRTSRGLPCQIDQIGASEPSQSHQSGCRVRQQRAQSRGRDCAPHGKTGGKPNTQDEGRARAARHRGRRNGYRRRPRRGSRDKEGEDCGR